jgi:hypothetical protein
MKAYTVTWATTIEAESPQEAAEIARDVQLDTGSTATTYLVIDEDNVETVVDLA